MVIHIKPDIEKIFIYQKTLRIFLIIGRGVKKARTIGRQAEMSHANVHKIIKKFNEAGLVKKIRIGKHNEITLTEKGLDVYRIFLKLKEAIKEKEIGYRGI